MRGLLFRERALGEASSGTGSPQCSEEKISAPTYSTPQHPDAGS